MKPVPVLSFLCVILFLALAASVRTCSVHKSDTKVLRASLDTTVSYYKLKDGTQVAQIMEQSATIDQVKNFALDNDKNLKEQIGNLNRLLANHSGTLTLHDTIYAPFYDTVFTSHKVVQKGHEFKWSNNYLDVTGFVPHGDSSISVAYGYAVDFNIATYYDKRPGLFKPRPVVTDLRFTDPSVRVTSFRGLTVKEPPKRWWETKLAVFFAGLVTGIFAGSK